MSPNLVEQSPPTKHLPLPCALPLGILFFLLLLPPHLLCLPLNLPRRAPPESSWSCLSSVSHSLVYPLVSSVFRPCFADTSTREGARTPGRHHQSVSLCIPFQSDAHFLEHPAGAGAVPFGVPGPECPGYSVPRVSAANPGKHPRRGSQARNPLR